MRGRYLDGFDAANDSEAVSGALGGSLKRSDICTVDPIDLHTNTIRCLDQGDLRLIRRINSIASVGLGAALAPFVGLWCDRSP